MLYEESRFLSGDGPALMSEQHFHQASAASGGMSSSESPQFVSPALARFNGRTSQAAYEVKCVVSAGMAVDLEKALRSSMTADPFSARETDGHYRITTLSTDTLAWDCFHRQPGYAKRKYRLRRYGSEQTIYLEQKTRRGHRVSKRRVATTEAELQQLFACSTRQTTVDDVTSGEAVASRSTENHIWDLQMFQNRIESLNLRPVCLMSYERRAWFAETESGPVRWTLDRHLTGAESDQWNLSDCQPLTQILPEDQLVCEFKFSGAMPQLFKKVIAEFQIVPGGFSKYRNSVARLTGMTLPSGVVGRVDERSDVTPSVDQRHA